MSEVLVPIAISSQLDITGEERIHAARYIPVTRTTFYLAPAISGDVPNMAVGDSISYQYIGTGSETPFSYEVTSGAMPNGLSLDPDTGEVTGTADDDGGTYSWTVTMLDADGTPATVDDGCYVLDMAGDPPDAMNGDDYSYTFTPVSGVVSYTFTSESGTLPTGTTLSSDGEISGTLIEAGTFFFSVTLTDGNGISITKSFNIGVSVDYGTIFVGSSSTAGANVPFTIVDGNTDTVTAMVLHTSQMVYPSLSSDGSRVYHYTNNELSYTLLSDNTIHSLNVGNWINGGPVLCDSTDTYLWALDFDDQILRKIRISDGVQVATYATGTNLTTMCWKDDTKTTLYLASYYEQYLRVFDTGTGTFGANIDSTSGVIQHFGAAVSSDTGYVYSIGTDTGVHKLVEFRPGLTAGTPVTLATDCRWVAVTPDGAKAYVTNTSSSGKVYVVDLATHSIVATITVGNTPTTVAINAAGSRAYVSCNLSNDLWVIDIASDLVIDTISVGTKAHGVAILEG